MSDLISRSALLKLFEDKMFNSKSMNPVIKMLDVIEIIEEQPTAYDKEAVENEVHNMRLDLTSHCREIMFDSDNECENLECTECVLSKVERVIKVGGIDG